MKKLNCFVVLLFLFWNTARYGQTYKFKTGVSVLEKIIKENRVSGLI
jgi:hypothetical protein